MAATTLTIVVLVFSILLAKNSLGDAPAKGLLKDLRNGDAGTWVIVVIFGGMFLAIGIAILYGLSL